MLTIVSFKADWCAPCKSMKPALDELKEELKDEVIFTDVKIDDNPQLVQEHRVRSIPTFVAFKDRTEVGRYIGAASKEDMERWIGGFRDLQPDVLPESSGGGDSSSSALLRGSGEQENS